MAYIIAICNQKGGVAKTATTHQLAAGLSIEGYKVLAIDIDPQYNLSTCCGIDVAKLEEDKKTIYEVLQGKRKLSEVIKTIQVQNNKSFDIAPSTNLLSKADAEFAGAKAPYLLKKALSEFTEYDFVFIDTPPNLSVLTVNALTAADCVIVPYKADALTVAGITQLSDVINEIKEYTNDKIYILGIVLTMYDTRTKIAKASENDAQQIAEALKTRVFDSKIRQCAAMRDLPNYATDIFAAFPNSSAAQDYLALCNELRTHLKGAIDEF